MDGIAAVFLENPLATTFGTAGLLCQLLWPLFRAHRAIVTVQFGIGADYSIHYALLDAWSGAAVAGLGATQSAAAVLLGDRPWFRWAGLVFLPAVAAVCYATWSGLPTLFAFAAVALIMIGRMQRDTLRLRVLMLAAAPFGMGYDILVGAAPALVGAIVSATIAAAMLGKEIRSRRAVVAAGAGR
ncbi:MAG: YgjV family protein [Hyphomicrobiales bacterium]|nr:YgjV family protein [Hyphomicrobiales bacterium]